MRKPKYTGVIPIYFEGETYTAQGRYSSAFKCYVYHVNNSKGEECFRIHCDIENEERLSSYLQVYCCGFADGHNQAAQTPFFKPAAQYTVADVQGPAPAGKL